VFVSGSYGSLQFSHALPNLLQGSSPMLKIQCCFYGFPLIPFCELLRATIGCPFHFSSTSSCSQSYFLVDIGILLLEHFGFLKFLLHALSLVGVGIGFTVYFVLYNVDSISLIFMFWQWNILAPPQHQRKNKSFSQAVSNSCDLPLCQLPPRTVKGDSVSVKISQHEYELGVEDGHRSLHARLTLQKRDSSLPHVTFTRNVLSMAKFEKFEYCAPLQKILWTSI